MDGEQQNDQYGEELEDAYDQNQQQQHQSESEAGGMEGSGQQLDTDASVDYKICGELRKHSF